MPKDVTIIYSWQEVAKNLSVDSRWDKAKNYLSESEQQNGIRLQRLWEIIDRAWHELSEYKLLNKSDLPEFLYEYYQHPVWLINAAFSESDAGTISDRLAAVRLIDHVSPRKILDFGGGIGTAARLCTQLASTEIVDLVDITEFRQTIQEYLSDFPSIRVLKGPEPPYDAVISTEVFEHLIDPVAAIIEINALLKLGGAFAASWSFGPGIQCHLPQNFHLRRLMVWIIRSLGFGFYGFERRGSTVYGFVKKSEVTPAMVKKARLLELFSRIPIPSDRLFLLMRGM